MVYDNCDLLICNNKEYTTRVGPRERLVSISNGVDLSIFHASNRPEDRDEKIIWVGSEYHRIIKGYDHFILPLFSKLQQKGLTCEARLVDSYGSNNASLQEMAEWYNTGTVLVCASEAEGTPNPVLEAAACGCAIVSTPVGNVPELVRDGINGYIVDRQLDSLLEGVLRACCHRRRLARQMSFDIRSWHWEFRVGRYYEEFRRVLEADPRPGSGEAASGGGASA